jgi:DNA-binding NarL/FixJ family response regulator
MVRVLSIENEFRVVAQCPDLPRLSSAVHSFRGGVLIVSSSLHPDVEKLVAEAREVGTRVMVVAEDSEPVQPYSSIGVSGVVYRSTTSSAFLECVRQVNRGDQFVPPGAATPEEDLVGARARARLTPKEMKIVALLVEGLKNRDIADRLNTSEQVIKNRLRSVYDKTGVSDRLELALFTLHHRSLAAAAARITAEMESELA